jgi:hypothetical protein
MIFFIFEIRMLLSTNVSFFFFFIGINLLVSSWSLEVRGNSKEMWVFLFKIKKNFFFSEVYR